MTKLVVFILFLVGLSLVVDGRMKEDPTDVLKRAKRFIPGAYSTAFNQHSAFRGRQQNPFTPSNRNHARQGEMREALAAEEAAKESHYDQEEYKMKKSGISQSRDAFGGQGRLISSRPAFEMAQFPYSKQGARIHEERRSSGPYEDHSGDDLGVESLRDEDIESLLMLLEGYALANGKTPYENNQRQEEHPLLSKAVLFSIIHELGKEGQGVQSRPRPQASKNEDQLLYLTPKRSKRIDLKIPLPHADSDGSRIKKEIDSTTTKIQTPPKVLATKEETTAVPTGKVILAPPKDKKEIDWSQYFGIDKKSDHETSHGKTEGNLGVKVNMIGDHEDGKAKNKVGKEVESEKKTKGENETEEKAERRWILNEFYKNLAMAGMRKKRNVVVRDDVDPLGELEAEMEKAGDAIVWDALKLTGAHKGESLTPGQLEQLKKKLIEKLVAAYSIEKMRDAIDGFRQELGAVAVNGIHK